MFLENHGKLAHERKLAPKIILAHKIPSKEKHAKYL